MASRENVIDGLPVAIRRHDAAYSLWARGTIVVAFDLALVLWQRLHLVDGGPLYVLVDNVAQVVGPLLGLYWCVAAPIPHADTMAPRQGWCAGRLVPALLGLGILSFALGQALWTYNTAALHQPPSLSWGDPDHLDTYPTLLWADVSYFTAYPFLLLGILSLPTRPLPLSARIRVFFDGLIIMTAVMAYSWYFILGPTFMHSTDSMDLATKIGGAAMPLFDLLLVLCLLVLWARVSERHVLPTVRLLGLGLVVIVVTDSLFDLQMLQGTYVTGGIVDAGWPLGYMLIGLGGYALRPALTRQAAPSLAGAATEDSGAPVDVPSVWRSLFPYAFVPPVGALAIAVWMTQRRGHLADGVYLGALTLIVLVVIRQVVSIVENVRLYRQEVEQRRHVTRLLGDLEMAHRQLQRYAEEAEELAVIRERNRMAREIHDTLAHYLTVVSVQIDVARKVIPGDPRRAATALVMARGLVGDCLTEVRRSVAALRPAALDNSTLGQAIDRLVDELRRTTGLDVQVTSEGMGTLPAAGEVIAYRAIQEALTNVRKHARARRAWLDLSWQPNAVRITVRDDGQGAADGATETLPGGPHFGLRGMRERVEAVGGKLMTEAGLGLRHGHGFRVTLYLPRASEAYDEPE